MSTFQDISGQRFGRLTVLHRGVNRGRRIVWVCQCDCSPEAKVPVLIAELRSGQARSCGCLRADRAESRRPNLAGKEFGRWLVLKQAPKKGKARHWVCQCSCPAGTVRTVCTRNLVSGASRSCGCIRSKPKENSEPLPVAA